MGGSEAGLGEQGGEGIVTIGEASFHGGDVTALVVIMAGVLSSPDIPSLTIKTWGTVDPVGFVNTAATELDGGSL